MKTSNSKAREMVQNTWEFKGSNTFAEWIGKGSATAYVVYSYGHHWPMFIKFENAWYENADRYSVTTSKQKNQLHPQCDTVKKTVQEMKKMVDAIKDRSILAIATSTKEVA